MSIPNFPHSAGQLAQIDYLGVDQRSESEAFFKNMACNSQCHADANVCLRQQASWRKLPLEATKDCMGRMAECTDLCKGF